RARVRAVGHLSAPASPPRHRHNPDRVDEPFEPQLTWLGQRPAVDDVLDGLLAGEDLAGAGCSPDPSGHVHALSAVVGLVPCWVEGTAGMEADSDIRRDDLVGERALDRNGCLERGLRTLERSEEAVTGLLDDLPSSLGDPLAQQLVMSSEQAAPLLVPQGL